MGDGTEQPIAAGDDAYEEAALKLWRARLLNGLLLTGFFALLPGVVIQTWQWRHDPLHASSGLGLSALGLAGLLALARWRASYEARARLLMLLGCVLMPAAMLTQGLDPGHFVAVGCLTTLGVLLFSVRAAYLVLGVSILFMVLSAFVFAHGYGPALARSVLDERVPMNWLRVGTFTFFPSAVAAAGTSFLLEKLRHTLRARGQLVRELRDEVSQRERALAELEQTQARLLHAQKLEAIGQLAAGIAHDFNNTLAVVALEAELLKRSKQNEPQVARAAESLLGAADRGKHLTQQLLLFSRFERGPRPVIDCTPVFSESVQALRRLLPSEIACELEVAGEPLRVCIAASELQQIVLNLGINARDAMPQGGELQMGLLRTDLTEQTASALALPAGAYALLCCRDTGAGMDAGTLGRVFEPFFTTKAPGRGTGLGLTNVWNITQRARGTVQVENHAARGAVLRVYLPLSDLTPPTSEPAPHLELPCGEKTVLVVEDDIRVRALLVSLLVDAGYKTLDAASVDAAIALDQQHPGPIDLLCTDVVMPGRPARELIATLRAGRPAIGVVICSGYSEDECIARGIRSGEFKHLVKPFTRDALLSAARNALAQRAQKT